MIDACASLGAQRESSLGNTSDYLKLSLHTLRLLFF